MLSEIRDTRNAGFHRSIAMGELQRYTSDLSDCEWQQVAPFLPSQKQVDCLREVDLREVLNAIFYRADNGTKWRNLPKDFPPWQTVYGYFRLWARLDIWQAINRALAGQVRVAEGREAELSLTIIDSQSVKLGEQGRPKLGLMAIRKRKVASVISQSMCLASG